jgi:hypothetical protein
VSGLSSACMDLAPIRKAWRRFAGGLRGVGHAEGEALEIAVRAELAAFVMARSAGWANRVHGLPGGGGVQCLGPFCLRTESATCAA